MHLGHSSTMENHSRSENRVNDVGRILEERKKGWSILIRSTPNGSSSESEPIERSAWTVGPGDGPELHQPEARKEILYVCGENKHLVHSVALHLNWIHYSCGGAWKNAAQILDDSLAVDALWLDESYITWASRCSLMSRNPRILANGFCNVISARKCAMQMRANDKCNACPAD